MCVFLHISLTVTRSRAAFAGMTVRLSIAIHGCRVRQFAERFERRKRVVTMALKHGLSRCTDEEHKAMFDLFGLRSDTDSAFTAGADEDARPLDGVEGGFRTGLFQLGFHHAEFFDGRVVEDGGGGGGVGGAVKGHVGVVDGGHLLLGDGGVGVGEHARERGDILEFGGEPGADDVVRGSHAFDDVCGCFFFFSIDS